MGGSEWRALCIMSGMVALWIASTWVKQIDIVLVAMVGASLMYLPGIDLLRWPDVQRATGWDGLLLIGAVTALGAASAKSGLAKWLVDAALGGVREWNAVWTILIISAFAVVIHLLLPIGPVINAVLIPPIAMLAADAGQSPALYGLPVAFTASCAFLLPLDAVPLITYGKGYYRMLDMLLPGALISVCWVLLITLLLTIARPLLWP
jgi:sodium-dependent dicarboxylate transporter 2/3/5